MQRILIPIFTFIWWNRLQISTRTRACVHKVISWRTAIVDEFPHGRHKVAFCFFMV